MFHFVQQAEGRFQSSYHHFHHEPHHPTVCRQLLCHCCHYQHVVCLPMEPLTAGISLIERSHQSASSAVRSGSHMKMTCPTSVHLGHREMKTESVTSLPNTTSIIMLQYCTALSCQTLLILKSYNYRSSITNERITFTKKSNKMQHEDNRACSQPDNSLACFCLHRAFLPFPCVNIIYG